MKKLLLTSIAGFALATSSALAADMAMKAPPPAPVPVTSWTGCYADAGVGYGMWNGDHNDVTNPGGISVDSSSTSGGRGWLGRVGGGCDYQFSGSNIVVGAFGDYDFMDVRGNVADQFFGLVGNEQQSAAWGVGGRIGYLVTPSLLTYWDGGFTETRANQINLNSAVTGAASGLDMPAQTYHGWFLGGGTDMSLSPWLPAGWFMRSEYRYSSFDAETVPVVVSATGGSTGIGVRVTPYVQTITTSLVYKFNWTGH
jgi:outer membrane immunogenic protein